jgi:hypothetical protein
MRRKLATILIAATMALALNVGQTAQASDPGAEADLANRVNILRNQHGIGGLTTHSVLTAKAEAWAQHMADTGCLCHSNLPDGVTVGWTKLGENIGRGPDLTSIHQALINSPLHLANMLDPAFHWIGVGIAYGNGQMYVSEVFMAGDPPPGPSPLLAFDSHGRGIAARAQGGFWVVQGDGTVMAYEGAPAYGYPHFPGDYARDIAAMPDGNGYVILDALGGVHFYGSALFTLSSLGGPWFGFDIARSIAVAPDGKGFAVLDGWGGFHRYGSAPNVSGLPYWRGWDIARSFSYRPGGGAYLLDGFGGVWPLGGAPRYTSTYFGWNIARDLTVWPDGKGYVVLDGFGGLHRAGSAGTPGPVPYQQIDRWRSVVVQAGSFLSVRNDGFAARS